jgi:N-acetylglucosamine-6-phosphate deacetylase
VRIAARHYASGLPVEIECAGGVIRSIAPPARDAADLTGGWVAPAFVDLQINGCDGISFNSSELTSAGVRHVIDTCRRHGMSAFFPTLVTNSFDALRHGLDTLARACDADALVAAALPGVHLEGPYISPDDGPRGAHPRVHVRSPDWDEFRRLQEAAGGRIRLVTLAPEHDGALTFIERLVASGVVVAIGHTAAGGPRIRDAVNSGARLSTHLGNGAHAMLPRHDNYIWEQLAADELWASVIGDGHHLTPAVLKCIVRVKTPARTILTCDASSLAGRPPGRYREWDQELEVCPDGRVLVTGTPYLAGSGSFTDACVGNVVRLAGVSLFDAVEMAGARPRELLGLPARRLEPGQPADLVLFDWEPGGSVRVRATVVGGRQVAGDPMSAGAG